jgi:hypothetical protein
VTAAEEVERSEAAVVQVAADKVAKAVDAPAAMEDQAPVAGDQAVVAAAWAQAVVVVGLEREVAGRAAVDQAQDQALDQAVVDPAAAVDQAQDQALVDPVAAAVDQVVERAEEVAGEPARFRSSIPIERWFSNFHGNIQCVCQPCGLNRIDSTWRNEAAGPVGAAREAAAPVVEGLVAVDRAAPVKAAVVEWVVDAPVAVALAPEVEEWVVDAPVAVKAAVAEWVADAPVAVKAAVVEWVLDAPVAVALAPELEAPWAAAAWLAAVLALGDREKWSPGPLEPPVKSPGI